jgi:Transcriptional Coactivator p15 (PC4)
MTVLAQDAPQGNSQKRHPDPEEVIVSEWPLNKREIARVTLGLYKGVWLVNCRKWFEADNRELQPGRYGVAFSIKHLPRLAAAITEVLSITRERGLLGGE